MNSNPSNIEKKKKKKFTTLTHKFQRPPKKKKKNHFFVCDSHLSIISKTQKFHFQFANFIKH